MQTLKAAPGARNLRSLVAMSPSARMLNLHGLAAEPPADPDYRLNPMFAHPVLNRAIILKHNVAPGAEERLAPRRFNATKVIFPLDPHDLNLGGQFLYIEQHDFAATLARSLEYRDLPLERDVTVLRILDRLPTLDPFLVREALGRQEIEVDRSYFRFSEPDKAQMLGFVEGEMGSLIKLCFGDLNPQDRRTKRLSRLLLADFDSPDLLPLQMTLQMDDDEFSEAMFSWKALLYYRWRTQALTSALKGVARSIARLGRRRCAADSQSFILAAKERLQDSMGGAWRGIGQTLRLYDRAYGALIEDQQPQRFRRFLSEGSGLFVELGESIGRLELIIGFWTHHLVQHDSGAISPDEVADLLRDLLQGLAIWPGDGGGATELIAFAPPAYAELSA
jgi:hypothetical protein